VENRYQCSHGWACLLICRSISWRKSDIISWIRY
jgi:hypothetical protein